MYRHVVHAPGLQEFMLLLELTLGREDGTLGSEELPQGIREQLQSWRVEGGALVCVTHSAVLSGEPVLSAGAAVRCATEDTGTHRRLSKHERKQLKHSSVPGRETTAVANHSGLDKPTAPGRRERYHILLEAIPPASWPASGSGYRVCTPADQCCSMLDILTVYRSVVNK